MKTVNFFNYGNYSSNNYGVNSLCFCDTDGNRFYFSYETLVAFTTPDGQKIVHQNDWKTTTGKHLNWIDGGDKKSRVDGETFETLYNQYYGER